MRLSTRAASRSPSVTRVELAEEEDGHAVAHGSINAAQLLTRPMLDTARCSGIDYGVEGRHESDHHRCGTPYSCRGSSARRGRSRPAELTTSPARAVVTATKAVLRRAPSIPSEVRACAKLAKSGTVRDEQAPAEG